MGVFTEQVQRLATEQEIIRREREEKRELKKKQEEAEKDLYYKIENIFACTTFTRKNIFKKFDNKKSIYNFLREYDTKNYLIEKTTKNVDVQYFLDKKYLSILKKIYTPYKEQEKEREKEEKEKIQQYKTLKKQYYLNVLQGRATLIRSGKINRFFFYLHIKNIYNDYNFNHKITHQN